jgi:hypothetical protein
MKQVIVSFNFDPETEVVSEVKCVVDGVEKKKKTTKKVKDIEEEMASEAILVLEPNKITFNNKAVAEMELEYEDRVVIKWERQGKQMIPIIGKDIAFEEEGTGNKITKANTITYKGKANAVLAEAGSEFTIELVKEGIWKLISTSAPITADETFTLEEVIKEAEDTEPDLLVETDEETEIDELQFQL